MTDESEWLTGQFEGERARLRGVAYRMLGSVSEADDAMQEAWLRISRADTDGVENMAGWLTTVVARVCLNLLRSREARREVALDTHVPDPIIGPEHDSDPEQQALLADSVGLALMVVLETLTPAERLAFVLHDMFAVPFDEIGTMLDRSPAAARQLASRGRRRVQGGAPEPDPDVTRQREVVDAYFAAARDGDFAALVAVLHPDVVLRADSGPLRPQRTVVLRGAETVAAQARMAQALVRFVRPALVNGTAGAVAVSSDRVIAVMGFTVTDGLITAIDVLNDPDRLAALDVSMLDD
ncbi:RNA polymerase sigma factor SigJ [Nocardioides sp. LHG3406-4]|uniref:RNA polymerase sigma factor SigJ n=1 Tax=Nocardioides sp. LHG3406-4 TaxID=2804575 RepID=UPI003CEAED95